MQLLARAFGALAVLALLNTAYRKARSGPKPWVACLLDSLLYVFSLGLCSGGAGFAYTAADAFKDAMASTGLRDAAGDGFLKMYETCRVAGNAKLSARTSPLGAIIQKRTLRKRMETRLKLVDYMTRHPTVGKTVFPQAPIFVIGFPRTGTTFLHELLGLHPDVRMHYSWEQMAPIPGTDDESAAAQVLKMCGSTLTCAAAAAAAAAARTCPNAVCTKMDDDQSLRLRSSISPNTRCAFLCVRQTADRDARYKSNRRELEMIVALAGEHIQVNGAAPQAYTVSKLVSMIYMKIANRART